MAGVAGKPGGHHGLMDAACAWQPYLVPHALRRACACRSGAVTDFKPNKGQRRVLKRNRRAHVRVRRNDDVQRYLAMQHDKSPGNRHGQPRGAYSSCVATVESVRDPAGQLLGVASAISAATTSAACITLNPQATATSACTACCADRSVPAKGHSALPGLLGQGLQAMEYKARYQPYELLIDGKWLRP